MLRRLTITFTEAERVALGRLAEADTRPVKDQVRVLVKQAAIARNLWNEDPDWLKEYDAKPFQQ